jgi:dTDP-4-amino-4,6-dideoxygalactose transaminase
MASMLGNFGPGDEVILPSYTFTSAATAVTQFGATPVFVDIDPITKCIDVNQVNDAVTDKTVAISWVNYAGVAPDIEALQSISITNNLLMIEDNAHGLGGSYKGQPLGSFGDFATQSFHATKNIQCGEGGAFIINNSDYIEKAEIIREKGTDRSKFIRGEIAKYQWMGKGSSYLLAESLAAILLGQLENFEAIQAKRIQHYQNYVNNMDLALMNSGNKIQTIPLHNKNVGHMFYLQIATNMEMINLLTQMKGQKIGLSTHYVPLDTSLAGLKFGYAPKPTSISHDFASRMIRLPLYYSMKSTTIEMISSLILEILDVH